MIKLNYQHTYYLFFYFQTSVVGDSVLHHKFTTEVWCESPESNLLICPAQDHTTLVLHHCRYHCSYSTLHFVKNYHQAADDYWQVECILHLPNQKCCPPKYLLVVELQKKFFLLRKIFVVSGIFLKIDVILLTNISELSGILGKYLGEV